MGDTNTVNDGQHLENKSAAASHESDHETCLNKTEGNEKCGGQFEDPVFKKLSRINGEINRMTKDQVKVRLAELHLDPRGHKDVLKKRLKSFYKRKYLARSAPKAKPKQSSYDCYIVIDFEATCEQNAVRYLHEIIEFPAVLVDASDGTVIDEFHSYVRPTRNSRLSEYCKQLTNITQEQVDSAPTFTEVLKQMEEWMTSHRLGCGKKFAVVTDGPWDMSRFMYLECRSSRIPFPRWATRWVNVRKIYSNSYRLSRVSLVTMLEYLGLSFEGRQHCGLDDARNIARILTYMIKDGCNVYVNERMFDSKLAALGAALSCQYDAEVTCVVRGDDDEDDDADAVAACVEDEESPADDDDDGGEKSAETTRVETGNVEGVNEGQTSGTIDDEERKETLHCDNVSNGNVNLASSCRSDEGVSQIAGDLNRLSVQHL